MAKRILMIGSLVVPWLFATVIIWYTWPAKFFVEPGDVIRVANPELVRHLRTGLHVCWLGMAGVLVWSLARQPRQPLVTRDFWAIGLLVGGPIVASVAARSIGGIAELVLIAASWGLAIAVVEPRWRIRTSAVMAVLTLPVVSFYCGPSANIIVSRWVDVAHVTGPEGRVYYWQRNQVLQGTSAALATEGRRSRFFTFTEVLYAPPGESGMVIVRPEGHREYALSAVVPTSYTGRCALVLSPDERWVAGIYLSTRELSGHEACVAKFAWDRSANRGYGIFDADFPVFALVGPSDSLEESDVGALRSSVAWSYPEFAEVALVKETHPSFRVRVVAAELLGATTSEVDRAQSVLAQVVASDPDEEVRQAANKALGKLARANTSGEK